MSAPSPLTAEQFGPLPRLDWLALELMLVDARYQRADAQNTGTIVRRIAENWDW